MTLTHSRHDHGLCQSTTVPDAPVVKYQVEKGRFFTDARFDGQREGLEKRAATETLEGAARMQFRFAVQQVGT